MISNYIYRAMTKWWKLLIVVNLVNYYSIFLLKTIYMLSQYTEQCIIGFCLTTIVPIDYC